MRVLVVGGGAREHAIAWKLRQSHRITRLFVAPGNGGTAALGENLPVSPADVSGLLAVARERRADLAIVGPEEPLARGIVDAFQEAGIPTFGPTQAAAQIEASKVFARELMRRSGIPCAQGEAFDDYEAARRYVEAHPLPVVVKADGLAAGKGVVVARTREEALAALRGCMVEGHFGAAGNKVVVEECLVGREASVFAFCDGSDLLMAAPACDYKPVYDDDKGPNTGGMGGYSPPEFLSPEALKAVEERIMRPALQAMQREGRPFTGVLYGGLMVTAEGPKALEFNCRLGDPEAQVLLPRLKNDLLDVIEACLAGNVSRLALEWREEACVGVVLASPGYPGGYPGGLPIAGLDSLDPEAMAFHAGTALGEDGLVTSGGRVVTVAALGATIEEARSRAYRNVERVRFEGAHYRRDIAARAQRSR